jgi:CheY-like chemotaxis protein
LAKTKSAANAQLLKDNKLNQLRKILHVDDDLDICTITWIVLQEIGGFDVRQCNSGTDAISEAPGFAPDLFLLDVMMPGMTGPETLRELRKLPGHANTPAIFMTAKAQPKDIAAYMSLGAIHVIPKPFDPVTLCGEITESWDQYCRKCA